MTVTTFAYTGAAQTFTVPTGATSAIIECWGAQGSGGASPGLGGYAKGTLIASPGTVLNIYVGGQAAAAFPAVGGFNGGGGGSGLGGGGASDVRLGGTSLDSRIVVAGGGGSGYNSFSPGGAGGGTSGTVTPGGTTPLPGTQTSGYALGVGGPGYDSGGASPAYGGGGGGGYYGGFGGRSRTGAGGSGYLASQLADASMQTGVRTGAGQVVITVTNVAPLAPTLTTPANNAHALAGETTPLKWTVNDTDAGDYQTKADVRWRKSGDTAWTTILTAATTAPQYVLPANTWTAGFVYEWQALTYDNASFAGPWAASSFVNVIAAVLAPTITTPAAMSVQYGSPVALEWTLPAGFSQDAYRVTRGSAADGTGTTFYDSGIVVTTGRSAEVPLDAVSGRIDYLRISYRYLDHWSPFASVAIDAQFGPPWVPLVVATADPATASVLVRITNPGASGGYSDTLVNDVYRTGPDGVRVRIAVDLWTDASFTDWLPGAGLNIYSVVAIAANGATAESR